MDSSPVSTASRGRPWKFLAMTLILVMVGVGAAIAYQRSPLYSPSQQVTCNDPMSVNSHVYNSSRLQVVKTCAIVAGTVDRVFQDDEGDAQIWLSLDMAYGNLTNNANLYRELALGVICVGQTILPDAVAACQNYSNSIPVPGAGVHVTVAGQYVLDTGHSGWAAIYPVYALEITGRSIGSAAHMEENINVSYVNNATSGWLESSSSLMLTPVTAEEGNLYTESLNFFSSSTSTEQMISIGILNDGFRILFVTPQTPISFSPGAMVTVSLTVHAPDSYYHGPLEFGIVAS